MTFLFECLTRTLGPVTGGNLENNRLQRVLLLPMESSKPAQVAQAATKKIDRKKESGIRYMVPSSNHDSTERGDLD